MKIIADEHIPFVKEYFGDQGELILMPGRAIQREDLLTADILLVRSVTRVNHALLRGTAIKFVGSVTTGQDHLDTEWLNQVGIPWRTAAGFNAVPVVEYVVSVIAALQKMELMPLKKFRAGVVGVGRIGKQVVEKLKVLGFDVVQCDPLRAMTESDFISTPIEDFADLDVVTLHTPLTSKGAYPTHHLIDKTFLQRQQKNCVLINTSRGAVVDFEALEIYGRYLYWCLDVWEHEPVIDFDVLQTAVIATPHIAGYSVQSKHRGIDIIYRELCDLGLMSAATPRPAFPRCRLDFNNARVDWRDVVLKIYDPSETTRHMQQALLENSCDRTFDGLRTHFQERYEFNYVEVERAQLDNADRLLLSQLGL